MSVFKITFSSINRDNGRNYWAYCELLDFDRLEDVYSQLVSGKPIMGAKLYCNYSVANDGIARNIIQHRTSVIMGSSGIAMIELPPDDTRFIEIKDADAE